jgi:predicted nuclease with TOPRIM domain
MAQEEEYEILPHQLLQDLKYEVESLKKKLTQPDAKANELILEIETMKDSVAELNSIFSKALLETKGESIGKTVTTLRDKVENVVSQNETIAKALIAISDKLDTFMQEHKSVTPATKVTPVTHTMGMPSMGGPGRVAPSPHMQMAPMPSAAPLMSAPSGMPPPPPMPTRRKGLFK